MKVQSVQVVRKISHIKGWKDEFFDRDLHKLHFEIFNSTLSVCQSTCLTLCPTVSLSLVHYLSLLSTLTLFVSVSVTPSQQKYTFVYPFLLFVLSLYFLSDTLILLSFITTCLVCMLIFFLFLSFSFLFHSVLQIDLL